MLATEVTENTEVFSIVGAALRHHSEQALAANSSRSDGLFAAKAAPTFTVVQIKTTKQAFASVANNYRINPLSLVKTQCFNLAKAQSTQRVVTLIYLCALGAFARDYLCIVS